MWVYQYNDNREYIQAFEVFDDTVPASCTNIPPPSLPWIKVWPVWQGTYWEMIPDYRNRTPEEFFESKYYQLAKEYWLKTDKATDPPRIMTCLGNFPDNVIFERPNITVKEKIKNGLTKIDIELSKLDHLYLTPRTLAKLALGDPEAKSSYEKHETIATRLRERRRKLLKYYKNLS